MHVFCTWNVYAKWSDGFVLFKSNNLQYYTSHFLNIWLNILLLYTSIIYWLDRTHTNMLASVCGETNYNGDSILLTIALYNIYVHPARFIEQAT